MRTSLRTITFSSILAAALFLLPPASALAASGFEVSGWLPYWSAASSTADVIPHLNELSEIDLFAYSVQPDGSLFDNAGLDQAPWSTLIADAKAQHVRVIATAMWSSTSAEHAILSNTRKRIALETTIADMVKTNGFDGVDIDFENKSAADEPFFSTFLKGLYERMGQKWVMCDIEARTPIDSLYYQTDIPPGAGIYANDFTAINKYCDRVRFMTYDQQGVDQQLAAQAASSSQLYAPIADPRWVQKVVALAEKSISPSKIAIGVPTYGYEYDVTAYANNEYTYDIMWPFDPGYAKQIEQQYGVEPSRNSAGEMQLTYVPAATSSSTVSSNPVSALAAAAAASAYADQYNSHLQFRLLDWPDAQSVAGKAELAQMLGVRGIAIFKLDGGEDPAIWTALEGVKDSSVSPTVITPSTGSGGLSPLTRDLALGMSGADVKVLQKILNLSSDTTIATSGPGSPGNETEMFGSLTKAAVETFQVKYGIASAGQSGYGLVGPHTRAKINALIASM